MVLEPDRPRRWKRHEPPRPEWREPWPAAGLAPTPTASCCSARPGPSSSGNKAHGRQICRRLKAVHWGLQARRPKGQQLNIMRVHVRTALAENNTLSAESCWRAATCLLY